jgi:ElaA protein
VTDSSRGIENTVHSGRWAELDPATLHDLIALRANVFVVEQNCPYPDLDGRDVEPLTDHVWTADANGPTSYLRILAEPDGSARIGRVCTRPDARGQGLAAILMTAALARVRPGQAVSLDAQAHLEGWYGRFGFSPSGPGFVEDGIPHVPMRREPADHAGHVPTEEALTPGR